jgi:RNA polymerase sigma factor (sigma-70 family)
VVASSDVLPVDPARYESIATLYERLRRPCASYMRQHVGNTAEFDDLYHATVVRLLQAQGETAITPTYFWTAFKRTLLDRVRSYGYRFTRPLADAFDPPAHDVDVAHQLSAAEEYERVFLGLEPQEEFWLRAAARGWPLQELANDCGATLEAVKSRVSRARRKAQATLAATV